MLDNFLIIYIIFSRISELILSYINTKNLMNRGGKEYYSSHYFLIVIFHIIFIIYFLILSLKTVQINLTFLYLFIILQFVRYKVIYDLGKYWTTRIIVIEDEPLVKRGLYKYFRHPNYAVVLVEIILICLIFSEFTALIFFSLIKLILISIRINYENKANSRRRFD